MHWHIYYTQEFVEFYHVFDMNFLVHRSAFGFTKRLICFHEGFLPPDKGIVFEFVISLPQTDDSLWQVQVLFLKSR